MSAKADTHVTSPTLVQRLGNTLQSFFRKIKNIFIKKSDKGDLFKGSDKRKRGRKNTNVDAF